MQTNTTPYFIPWVGDIGARIKGVECVRMVKTGELKEEKQQEKEGKRPEDMVEWEDKEACKHEILGGQEPQEEKAMRQLRSLHLTAEPEVPERRVAPQELREEELREVLQRVREGGRRYKREVRGVVVAHSPLEDEVVEAKRKGLCEEFKETVFRSEMGGTPVRDPSGKPP